MNDATLTLKIRVGSSNMFQHCVNMAIYHCNAGEGNAVVRNQRVSNQFGVERSQVKTCKNEFYGRTTHVHRILLPLNDIV